MKKITIFLFIAILMALLYVPALRAQTSIEVSDTIWADETWSVDTVKVVGNVVVVDDVTLTIAPGTRVEFQGYHYLNILGTILAVGTKTDTIVFTPADTSGFSNFDVSDGAWNGMIFNNGKGYGGADGAMSDNDTSRFEYCLVEFSKSIPSDELVWGTFEIHQFSNLIISHCEIRNNYNFYRGGAFTMYQNSDIKILNNYIHDNIAIEWSGGIYSHTSAPVIAGNTINYNKTLSMDPRFGRGGGIGIIGENPVIRNNLIQYNQAIYGAGINMNNSFGIVENNTIANNVGYYKLPDTRSIGGGIYMEQTSAPSIRSNIISSNTALEGGGIFFDNSEPEIINNLIVNNTGSDAGGALFGFDSYARVINNTISRNESFLGPGLELTNTRIDFINSILWDNGGFEIHLQDRFAYVDVKNSIIQDTANTFWGAGNYNITSVIDKDPLFNEVSAGYGSGHDGLDADWAVDTSSPCINAGETDILDLNLPVKDLQGNQRIHHNIIDIGAYELHIPLIYFNDTVKADTTWIADTVKVNGDITVNDDVTLTILPGTYVEFQDSFRIKVNGTLIARGNPNHMIIFTVADTNGFHDYTVSDGGWGSIIFDNSYDGMNNEMADNDSSIFSFCHFSYSKATEPNSLGGALSVKYYSKVKVSDCIFSNNSAQLDGGAIYLNRSDMIIQNCRFYNNTAGTGGGAIMTEREVNIKLMNNTFMNNSSGWRGGAINLYTSDAVIDHNIFIENYSQDRGGAVYLRQTPGIISANFISNNYSGIHGGGMCLQEKNCQLTNNIVINNSANNAGGGIYFLYIDDFLTANNTVSNNWANTGGGIYNAFTNHRANNDILYGNDCATYGKQYGLYSTQVSLDFKNCNIEGGPDDIGFWQGQVLPGTYTDIVDSFPHFINPSDGPGNGFNGTTSNWNLKSISPCINAGTLAGIINFIGNKDFTGNSRIYADSIDIGAYESQYGIPVITLQPLNQVACAGDTVILAVQTQYQSYYQWQKDGKDIPGATSNELRTDSITQAADGNYQCIVSNSFGSVASVPIYVVARSAPEIILQPEDTWAVEGERTIMNTNATGTPPIRYQWFKETTELPGKRYPELWIFDTGPNMEGAYHCEVSNACGSASSDTVQLYLAPQICMVTVDTASGNNLVVWEKNSSAPVESYNIYRESIVAGEYDLIGNIAAEDLSVFEDTLADPFSQGYIYKITALDADQNESDLNLCKPHKTIHLLTSINTEEYSIQCDWDQYYGFDYGTFIIYRAVKGNPLDSIHAISRSFNTWIDRTSAENVDYVYRIAARRLETCYPTGNAKAGSGPYSHSMSNVDDNRLQATGRMDVKSIGTLQIFPNPVSDHTTIRFPNPDHSDYQLIVRDLSGKAVLLMSKITEEQVVINRDNLRAGYYSVEIVGEKIYRGKMIIE
ncbi:MAG: hypothetical protein AMS27_04835 [Bacteroides sp. SM23_62_1]|nr:MAG: hypothetical protein AMS27_04835 [Bacteroides sp. SM23_62_1]